MQKKDRNIVIQLLQRIYCIYAISLFIILMLLFFPFFIIAAMFGKIKGGNLVYRICTLWADIWFPCIGIIFKKIYEGPYDTRKQYVFVSNHISFIDAAVLVKAIRQPVRALGRAETSKVPLFGYIYKNAIVTVDRSSVANRVKSVGILKSIIRKGISVMVFPEGTFNMTGAPLKEFFDGAFKIAIETQTPVKPVLYLDTYNRMHYSGVFTFTPGRCRIVYLPEIDVQQFDGANKVKDLKATVYKIMEEALLRYNAPWIKH